MAKEVSKLNMRDVSMTLHEFEILFQSFRPIFTEPINAVLKNDVFQKFVKITESQLRCTIEERDQKAEWNTACVRVLAYVSLHAEFDAEERVGVAIGGVARADKRRLEDLRASFEGSAMDVLSVGASISALVQCLCGYGVDYR
jgi:hypothetical protein